MRPPIIDDFIVVNAFDSRHECPNTLRHNGTGHHKNGCTFAKWTDILNERSDEEREDFWRNRHGLPQVLVVISRTRTTRVTVLAESTLNPNTSPAVTLVVQPVSVLSWFLIAVLSVGLALAAMVSATVGG